MTGLPGYAPSEEHELLRRTVRDLADAKIAPAHALSEAGPARMRPVCGPGRPATGTSGC
jgi:hypothetical protein